MADAVNGRCRGCHAVRRGCQTPVVYTLAARAFAITCMQEDAANTQVAPLNLSS